MDETIPWSMTTKTTHREINIESDTLAKTFDEMALHQKVLESGDCDLNGFLYSVLYRTPRRMVELGNYLIFVTEKEIQKYIDGDYFWCRRKSFFQNLNFLRL